MRPGKFIILGLLLGVTLSAAGQPVKRTVSTGQVTPDSITMDFFKYQTPSPKSGSPVINSMRQKAGMALLSSALIPGLGQAVNKKWIRAGAYFVADAILMGVHFNKINKARRQEREYEQFANQRFSVVAYARWLVEYHDQNNIPNPYIDQLRQQVTGVDPSFNPEIDWNIVDLEVLRNVERNTPFIFDNGVPGNNFSHVMPDYGSQQYYELISKYYQFGPGWTDFGTDQNGSMLDNLYQLSWDGTDMPVNFFEGADMAEMFNDNYRIAGNMISFMILNHVVSAFDAYLTVKLRNNKIETETNLLSSRQFTIRYYFN